MKELFGPTIEWFNGDFEDFIKVLDEYGSEPFAVSPGEDKFVYLTNSIWSGYWRVIGINHDNTEDTVDLIPTKIMGGRNRTSTSSSGCYDFSSNSQLYHYNNNSNDYLRYYIENDIVNGFDSAIQSRLTTFNYVCETSTATDANVNHTYTTYSAKACPLSWTEIGAQAANINNWNQYTGVEGTIYEYFSGAANGDSRYILTDGVTTRISSYILTDGVTTRISSYLGLWGLRSRYTNGTSSVIYVYSGGHLNSNHYSSAYFGAVPRIRFKRQKNNDKPEIHRIKVKSALKYPDCAVKINKPKDINSGREWFSGDFEDFIKVLDEYGSKPFAVSPGEDKFVYLTNSIWSGNWRVIGINHDGTSDTVDLMPTKIMGGRNSTSDYFTDCYDFSSNSQLYHKNGNSNDYLRYYIENDIVNGFDSNIRNRLTTFNYTCSEGTGTGTTGGSSDTIKTYSAKAVALSWTEVGGKESATNYCPKAEGTRYEFFSSSKTAWSTFGTDLDLKMTDGVTTRNSSYLGYWGLRSRYTSSASIVIYVDSSGYLNNANYYNACFGGVPRIRFKRQKNNDNPEIHKINGSKDLKSNKKLKMMISQPMSGREEDVIRKERDEIAEKYIFSEGLELVDTFFMDEAPEGTKNPHIFYLARALKEMANADGVIFAPGWRKARGCIIEYEVAKKYGLYIKDLEAR